MQSVERYSHPYFSVDEIEAHWDKQVWFWKRRNICRFTEQVANYDEAEAFQIEARNSGALHGVVVGEVMKTPPTNVGSYTVGATRAVEVRFAFPDKRSAMLFKLAHGGAA